MNFSESLHWFVEPGFVGLLFVLFFSAWWVSAKAPKKFQIFIAAYCTVYMITQWSKDDYFSMGLWWMYCGWAGFLFHKFNGSAFLAGVGRVLGNKVDAMGRTPAPQNPPQSFQHTQQQHTRPTDREDTQRQAQEAYRQRESQREQQKAREQAEEFAEEFTKEQQRAGEEQRQAEETRQRQRNQQKQDQRKQQQEPPPKPKPAPDPEPAQEEPPPPKPKPKRKRPWWEVLEVSKDADLKKVNKAKKQMLRRYHPDKVSHFGEEVRLIAEEKTKEINNAFDEATE